MKKHLVLLFCLGITLSGVATPWDIKSPKVRYAAWDKLLDKSRAFTDPYCNYQMGTITGSWPNQTFNLQATLDHSPHVTWLVQIQVLGIWYGNPGYPNSADYKVFDFVYSGSQWNKTINYSLGASEEAYPGVMDVIYDGPY